ncbi:sensor domain-containing protein [Natrarchaeobius oligotrophus]|uniref:Histidine kinase n=1 Tax=Natrarchaeobius chitinivorans TaxID=1679083 RepID=A0A3N6PF39_NATCH|nr:sensor domain-containing protein [Natrarchaeobius chitinivorans]RQG98549.1 histidine kinase [Natrarchaeobius chitinivorans]
MGGTSSESVTALAHRVGDGLRWFAGVALRRRTYLNLAYLLLAFPLGMVYFVGLTVALSVGIGLTIVLIGIPILLLAFLLAQLGAQFERWLTSQLLPVELEARRELEGESRRERATDLLLDRSTWTAVLYLPSVFLVGVFSFVVATTALSTAFAMLTVPFYYDRPGLYVGVVSERAPEFHQTIYLAWNQLLVGFEAVLTIGYWEITTLSQALVVALGGVVLALATLHVLNGIAALFARWARATLDGGYDVTALIETS